MYFILRFLFSRYFLSLPSISISVFFYTVLNALLSQTASEPTGRNESDIWALEGLCHLVGIAVLEESKRLEMLRGDVLYYRRMLNGEHTAQQNKAEERGRKGDQPQNEEGKNSRETAGMILQSNAANHVRLFSIE